MSKEEKTLSFKEILAKGNQIKKIYIEELGASISYGELNFEELSEVYEQKGKAMEMSLHALYLAWKKADPEVNLDDLRKTIPGHIVLKLTEKIVPGLLSAGPLGKPPAPSSAKQPSDSKSSGSASKK